MCRLDITRFSKSYLVNKLTKNDISAIYDICLHNPLFYQYYRTPLSNESIENDMLITPPGKDISDKYYVGFYKGDKLVAIMDLINDYHEKNMAFIGFFMMNSEYSGKGIGTQIITELCEYLREEKHSVVRLGINKGNPQSTHFWAKNGFVVKKEIEREDGIILLAERKL